MNEIKAVMLLYIYHQCSFLGEVHILPLLFKDGYFERNMHLLNAK